MILLCDICGRIIQDDNHTKQVGGTIELDPIYEHYSQLIFPDEVVFKTFCSYCEKDVPGKSPHKPNAKLHNWEDTKTEYAFDLPNHPKPI